MVKVKVLDKWWQHMIGYMFQKPTNSLLFKFRKAKRVSIHTWFVFGSIDVLVLDEKNNVIEEVKNLSPWKTWTSKKAGYSFVETPSKIGQ